MFLNDGTRSVEEKNLRVLSASAAKIGRQLTRGEGTYFHGTSKGVKKERQKNQHTPAVEGVGRLIKVVENATHDEGKA